MRQTPPCLVYANGVWFGLDRARGGATTGTDTVVDGAVPAER